MSLFYWILLAGTMLAVAFGALALHALGSDVNACSGLGGAQCVVQPPDNPSDPLGLSRLLVAAVLDRRVSAWALVLPLVLLICVPIAAEMVVLGPGIAFAKTHGLWEGDLLLFSGIVLTVILSPYGVFLTLIAWPVRSHRDLSGPRT